MYGKHPSKGSTSRMMPMVPMTPIDLYISTDVIANCGIYPYVIGREASIAREGVLCSLIFNINCRSYS